MQINSHAVAILVWSILSVLLAARPLPAVAQAPIPNAPEIKATPAELAIAQQANTTFAVDLYRQLAKENAHESIFVSPFSVSIALTIATEGAVGETAKEMATVLHLPADAVAAGSARRLSVLHRGQAGLAANFAPPLVPAATRDKIKQLRTQLDAANKRATGLERSGKFEEAQNASQDAQRAANELNALLKNVDQYELRIANALWAEKSYQFKPSYFNAIQPTYGAVLFPVDFKGNAESARANINHWVEEQTNQRIKDLIPINVVGSTTRLVITNAVYFLGEWEEPFLEQDTKDSPFAMMRGKHRKIPLMHQHRTKTASYAAVNPDGTPFKSPREIPVDMKETDSSLYPADGGLTLVTLPYKGKKLSMVWLLPRTSKGLAHVEGLLTAEKLSAWLSQFENRTVELSAPRFKLESNYGLVPTLKSLGMSRAFVDPQDPHGAQFDNMSQSHDPNDKLYIGDVVHKTFVEVNEKGTEAAAATAVIMAEAAAAMPARELPKMKPFIPIFKADHPFLFLIRDNETGSVLFVGRYLGRPFPPAQI